MSTSLPTGLSDVQLPSAVLVRTWRRQVRLDLACNYESHTLLIQTFAHEYQLATRLSTEVRIRPNGEHPVTPQLS